MISTVALGVVPPIAFPRMTHTSHCWRDYVHWESTNAPEMCQRQVPVVIVEMAELIAAGVETLPCDSRDAYRRVHGRILSLQPDAKAPASYVATEPGLRRDRPACDLMEVCGEQHVIFKEEHLLHCLEL